MKNVIEMGGVDMTRDSVGREKPNKQGVHMKRPIGFDKLERDLAVDMSTIVVKRIWSQTTREVNVGLCWRNRGKQNNRQNQEVGMNRDRISWVQKGCGLNEEIVQ